MTSWRTPSRATAAVAAVMLVGIAGIAPAGAAPARGLYQVRSIVLTYNGSATTKAAQLRDGTTGTLTTTITATLRGKVGPEGPATLSTPETANQYLCSPACPSFVAGGTAKVVRTFTPSPGGGAKKTCTKTGTIRGATGRVYVSSGKRGTKTLSIRLQDTKGANDLYADARGTCALPDLYPVDSSDYSAFGERTVPTSKLGSRTIAVSLANTLKPPTYPAPATGKTTVTAAIVLELKG